METVRSGDTIVVKSVDNQIEIENKRSHRILLCNSCIQSIVIGSDPANFPSSTRIKQRIYIANTDLLQVSVVNETAEQTTCPPCKRRHARVHNNTLRR